MPPAAAHAIAEVVLHQQGVGEADLQAVGDGVEGEGAVGHVLGGSAADQDVGRGRGGGRGVGVGDDLAQGPGGLGAVRVGLEIEHEQN